MKLRFLILPALMAITAFAQGPGPFGPRGQGGTPPTPPTPEQAATAEANRISTLLRLSSTETSTLVTVLAGTAGALTTEQTTLQANAATLKADFAALASDLATGGSTSTTVSQINTLELANLQARVTGASAVLAELTTLKVTLTATQQTNLINLLVRGGPGGFRR